MSSVKAVPEGYHSVTPYLFIKGASAAIDLIPHVARPIRTLDELMQEQQRHDRPREKFLAR